MSTKEPTDSSATEHVGTSDPNMEKLCNEADQILRQIDRMIHDELSDKTEFVAGWDKIMREYEEVLAEEQREAEEKKLDSEIREWMDRIRDELDRLTKLDPVDLEADEAVVRTFAALRDIDAVIRLRCRHYPEKLAEWENEVMAPVKQLEAVFAAVMEAEEAKPGN